MILPEGARAVVEAHAAAVPFGALKRAAALVSETYREGGGTGDIRLTAELRVAAYLVARMPATYAAALAALSEVRKRFDAEPATLLDVGGGTGATALAASQIFSFQQITVLERDRALAEAGRQIVPHAEWRLEDLMLPAEHDLVVAGYSLGEVSHPEEAAWRLWQRARMALVIIEPGTTRGFALVRRVRDRLLAAGAHVLAPCPSAAACPIEQGDWCHFAARVERSALHRRLKNGALAYEDEKFSYIALGREPGQPAPGRVIRHPQHQPGLIRLQVCADGKVSSINATHRMKETFRAARKAHWGDPWY